MVESIRGFIKGVSDAGVFGGIDERGRMIDEGEDQPNIMEHMEMEAGASADGSATMQAGMQ